MTSLLLAIFGQFPSWAVARCSVSSTEGSALASDISSLSATADGANPPKTTLCTAPIRAQAGVGQVALLDRRLRSGHD